MRLPDTEKAREELKKLYAHPHARYWGVAFAGLAIILSVLAFLLSIQDTTPVEDFLYEQWRSAMESKDGDAYTQLWDENAREEWSQDFETARSMVERQQLAVHLKGIQPTTDPVDPKGYLIQGVPITFERDGEPVTTHHTVRLARRGLRRHWKVISHNISYPEPETPVVARPPSDEEPTTIAQSTSEQPASATTIESIISDDAPLDTSLKLRQIIGAWHTAWEQKNLDDYLSWYAKEADIVRVMVVKGKEYERRLRKDQLRRHMERLNRKYSKIEIKLANLNITGDTAVADVSFLQEFSAWTKTSGQRPTYRDLGTKRLKFMVDPGDGNWKIYSERWTIYRDVPYKL